MKGTAASQARACGWAEGSRGGSVISIVVCQFITHPHPRRHADAADIDCHGETRAPPLDRRAPTKYPGYAKRVWTSTKTRPASPGELDPLPAKRRRRCSRDLARCHRPVPRRQGLSAGWAHRQPLESHRGNIKQAPAACHRRSAALPHVNHCCCCAALARWLVRPPRARLTAPTRSRTSFSRSAAALREP